MDSSATSNPAGVGSPPMPPPQFALLDFLLPGFSVFSSAVQTYLGVDLNLYIPLVLIISGLTFAWTYISEYAWGLIEKHLMSVVRIRVDDEIYNMIMTWVTQQGFAQKSRNFIVNTNVNSRCWYLYNHSDDEDDEDEGDESNGMSPKKKSLQYTPSFGTHFFWYKGSLLLFDRYENREQASFLNASEREEIAISCFGRNPRVLKELLVDARAQYMKRDESKTLIYRAAASTSGGDPSWQRCMSRSSRPFSTVILNEKTKTELIDDVTDYLNPATRRWYSNRGIPYRRGYLLHGPPGTGKSSLSLALAGFFQMRIYMISLSSIMANEENLASLFADLPRRCVVLLEDIDSAGLTHTREDAATNVGEQDEFTEPTVKKNPAKSPTAPAPVPATAVGRLSLSGLLNILDGVASQEGRVLIMTTNHPEKLDKALIRPGRVDMIVEFGLATADMTAAIFRAIYAPYDGEEIAGISYPAKSEIVDHDKARELAEKESRMRKETTERVNALATKFATKIPELEFSPAEIQGLLLKHKRNPEAVIECAEEWVVDTRKEKKQKELDEAEKRRKEEEDRRKEAEKDDKTEKEKEEDGDEEKKTDPKEHEPKEEKKKARKARNKSAKADRGGKRGSERGVTESASSESEAETKSDEKKEKGEANKESTNLEANGVQIISIGETTDGAKTTKGTSDSGYDTPEYASNER